MCVPNAACPLHPMPGPELPQKEDPGSQCGLPPLGDMALEPPRNWWEGKERRIHIKTGMGQP